MGRKVEIMTCIFTVLAKFLWAFEVVHVPKANLLWFPRRKTATDVCWADKVPSIRFPTVFRELQIILKQLTGTGRISAPAC